MGTRMNFVLADEASVTYFLSYYYIHVYWREEHELKYVCEQQPEDNIQT